MTDERHEDFDVAILAGRDGRTVVSVHGEIDAYTAPRLREVLSDLLRQGKVDVVVDLREVSFIDSSGLSVVITAAKAARRDGGDIVLASPSPVVFRVFEIAGLTKVLTFSDALSSRSVGGASA